MNSPWIPFHSWCYHRQDTSIAYQNFYKSRSNLVSVVADDIDKVDKSNPAIYLNIQRESSDHTWYSAQARKLIFWRTKILLIWLIYFLLLVLSLFQEELLSILHNLLSEKIRQIEKWFLFYAFYEHDQFWTNIYLSRFWLFRIKC